MNEKENRMLFKRCWDSISAPISVIVIHSIFFFFIVASVWSNCFHAVYAKADDQRTINDFSNLISSKCTEENMGI